MDTPEVPVATEPVKVSNKKLVTMLVVAVVVLVLVIVAVVALSADNGDDNLATDENTEQEDRNTNTVEPTSEEASEETLIKHLGIDLDYYDPLTSKAGDIVFTQEPMGQFDLPFFDFGYTVPASSAGPAKSNPQPTFIAPLGTKVHSLVDGVVTAVPVLYSGDYSIHVASKNDQNMIFETEHVINPLVAVGDTVTAGQVIAEVSDYDAHNYAGYGLYEIGILIGGNPPQHVCPFLYLDESIKESTYAILRDLYKSWNEFRGEEVYDVNLAVPGCITTDAIDG